MRQSYLVKSRHSTKYYFRAAIPLNLRLNFGGKREIRRSLHTDSYTLAKRQAIKSWLSLPDVFDEMTRTTNSSDDLKLELITVFSPDGWKFHLDYGDPDTELAMAESLRAKCGMQRPQTADSLNNQLTMERNSERFEDHIDNFLTWYKREKPKTSAKTLEKYEAHIRLVGKLLENPQLRDIVKKDLGACRTLGANEEEKGLNSEIFRIWLQQKLVLIFALLTQFQM